MKKTVLAIIFLIGAQSLFAQNTDVRREIDIDRRDIPFASQEAFEKSREYIRKDSTYYIGWMYKGAYLFNRANDAKGFWQAITALQKAFELIEKDYDKELRTRTNDFVEYFAVSYIQNDYSYIANWLEGSYQNVEEAQKAYEVLTHVKDRDLQYEAGVESWNTLAWLYHRNRMYTSEKFPFLKNSVDENDSMAYACLDSAIMKIHRDNEINQGLFDPTWMSARYYFTYHYKVILFTYDFELDSADYYYDILLGSGYYSSNNFANYQYMKGEFAVAEQFYLEAEQRDETTEKHTREYFYMRGLLEVYRGTPERADTLLKGIIGRDGTTPGYGWHNIALARAMLYEGLTTDCQRKVNTAARFEELHIGTTWGQEQYNLSVASLNYMNALRFESEYYFENDEWSFWLNPVNWYNAIEYNIKVHHYQLVLVSLVASNPERAEVLYPLFTSENLLGWDESWQMLDGFSNKFFIEIYKNMLENDPRPGAINYIKFVLARLYISDGNEDEARELLDDILQTSAGNQIEFDKLLYARVCEALAEITDGEESQAWLQDMYNTYPQLVPFTGRELTFNVTVEGENYDPEAENFWFQFSFFALTSAVVLCGLYLTARWYFRLQHNPRWIYTGLSTIALCALIVILVDIFTQEKLSDKEEVLGGFSNCNIGFTSADGFPTADITFEESDSTLTVHYDVKDDNDRLVNSGMITVDKDQPEQTGTLLAYRLFNINLTYSNSAEVEAEDVESDTEEEE